MKEITKEHMIELKKIFDDIKRKKYVESIKNDESGIGYTFESLINKLPDSSIQPDYKEIEIKTKTINVKENLTLFTMVPKSDNKILYSKYILNNYGYSYNYEKDVKRFSKKLYCNQFNELKGNLIFKTTLDYNQNRLIITILDRNFNIINNSFYWDLEELKNRIYTKLNYLAYVEGECNYINRKKFFKYVNINFYELKSFNTFLDLLKKDIIYICFNMKGYFIDNNIKTIRNRGVFFKINPNNIDKLFNKINI